MRTQYKKMATAFLAAAAVATMGAVCCGASDKGTDRGDPEMALTLPSTAFEANDSIPSLYTCDGDDISPPLSWSGVPESTRTVP